MSLCKGKTLKGGSCKKKCKKGCKYCYCHKGGVLNPKATAFVPGKMISKVKKKKKTPSVKMSYKRPSISASMRRKMSVKKKSVGPIKVFKTPKPKTPKSKKYVPPHLRKKKSPKKKSPKKSPKKSIRPVQGRFARRSPPKRGQACVNYQHTCKYSKFGDVYQNKCHPRNYIDYNVGLKNQGEKCFKMRKDNRKCRIASGLDATPKHNHAIKVIEDNVYYCGIIIDDQVYPRKRRKSFKTPGRPNIRR